MLYITENTCTAEPHYFKLSVQDCGLRKVMFLQKGPETLLRNTCNLLVSRHT